jgi:hypothetical protein
VNDSQLTEGLRAALDEVTASVGARPGLAARARTAGRRRRATRGLVAGLPALALAAGAAVALHGGAPTTTSAPATSTSGTAPAAAPSSSASAGPVKPKAETVAYEKKQIEVALANASNYMIRTEQSGGGYPGGVSTQWTDPRTAAFYEVPGDGPGKSATWIVENNQQWRNTSVDYTEGTWSTAVLDAPGTYKPDIAGGSPAELAQMIKLGFYKIVGHGTANGHDAIKLFRDWGPFDETIWIDARTYEPVHIVKWLNGKSPLTITIDEFWGPRTPSLVKLVNNPVIPARFKQVSPPS